MKMGSALILGTLLSAVVLQAAAQDDGRAQRARGTEVRNEFAPSRPVADRPLGERPEGQRSLINRADADGDGNVSEAEFVDLQTANTESRFAHRDRNADGSLDRDEAGERERPGLDIDIEALRACIASYGEDPDDDMDRFTAADLDGDGLLSLVEFSTYLQQRAYVLFDRIDTNDDGYISPEEVQADHDERENHRRIVKACMEEVRSDI